MISQPRRQACYGTADDTAQGVSRLGGFCQSFFDFCFFFSRDSADGIQLGLYVNALFFQLLQGNAAGYAVGSRHPAGVYASTGGNGAVFDIGGIVGMSGPGNVGCSGIVLGTDILIGYDGYQGFSVGQALCYPLKDAGDVFFPAGCGKGGMGGGPAGQKGFQLR